MYLALLLLHLLHLSWNHGSLLKCNQLKSLRKYSQLKSFLSELTELVPLYYFPWGLSRCSKRLHDFSVTPPRCYKNVYVCMSAVFFLAELYSAFSLNFLSAECFLLSFDLNGIKSKVYRYPLSFERFFLSSFLIYFTSFSSSVSCNFMPCSGFSALYGVNPKWVRISMNELKKNC